MKTITFFIKLLLMILWSIFASALVCLRGILFFGDPQNFYYTVHLIGWGIFKIGGFKMVVDGKEHLGVHHPCLYVGNHQSAFDVATYGSITPKGTVAVGKKEIKLVPFFGFILWSSGSLFLDRKNRKVAIDSMKRIAQKIQEKKLAVGIMPEGTRNKEGVGLLPFKKGAFHLAIAAQVPIVPVISAPLKELANFSTRTLRPGLIHFKILPPIETKGLTEADVEMLSETTRRQMLAALEELSNRSA